MTELLEELKRLEVELHRSDARRNGARLQELLHTDFEEIGRSGRRYSRDQIISELAGETDLPEILAQDFRLVEIGSGVALLTYVSAHRGESGAPQSRVLRSSLWVRGNGGWQVLFHQGSPIDG